MKQKKALKDKVILYTRVEEIKGNGGGRRRWGARRTTSIHLYYDLDQGNFHEGVSNGPSFIELLITFMD
jgi:hypothetical protein